MNFTKYNEAVDWLFKQAPNYQIDGQKAYKPGLGNIQKLCDFFGNPQKKLQTIHIGGTNGKGVYQQYDCIYFARGWLQSWDI